MVNFVLLIVINTLIKCLQPNYQKNRGSLLRLYKDSLEQRRMAITQHVMLTKMTAIRSRTGPTRMRAKSRRFKLNFKTVWTFKGCSLRLKFKAYPQDPKLGSLRLLKEGLAYYLSLTQMTLMGKETTIRASRGSARQRINQSQTFWKQLRRALRMSQAFLTNFSNRRISITILCHNWAPLIPRSCNNAS